jgi:hypothetical protein
MERLWLALLLVAFAMTMLAWVVPRVAEASGRPRFVVALVAGALTLAAFELWRAAVSHPAGYERFLLGIRMDGAAARVAAAANAALCAIAAFGLWRMRAWARWLAMGYLGFLIGSFLLWGVRGSTGTDLTTVMLWQMFVLPFLTFALMYLQRGGRYFKS